jgi:hypothetical protein
MIHDEFFSFTTPNKGFQFTAHSKMILVTVQFRPEGHRIVSVLSIAATTIRMLEFSGASHIPADKLPPHIRRGIDEFEQEQVHQILKRSWDDLGLNGPPTVKTIQ